MYNLHIKRLYGYSMYYLIDQFISNSESIYLYPKDRGLDSPLIKSIHDLKAAFLNPAKSPNALAEADALDVQGENPYLLLQFLELRAKLSVAAGRIADGLALVSQIKSIVNEDMPAEYKIIPFTCEGCLYAKEGKSELSERMIEKSLFLVSPNEEKYQYLLLEYAMQLALQCRLTPIKEKVAKINVETKDASIRNLSNLILYIDCLYKGDLEFASILEASLENHPEISKYFQNEIQDAKKFYFILQYNQGIINEDDLLLNINKSQMEPALVYLELIKKKPVEALQILHSTLESNEEYFKRPDLLAFLPICAELACGHFEIARSLLKLKSNIGNYHFLDHFFWARIEYLAGNIDEAMSQFKTAYENSIKNECVARLEFEIELSYELKLKDIQYFWEYSKNPLTKSNNTRPLIKSEKEVHYSMLGESPELNSVFESIRKYAPLDLPVLIIGETGTGKELTAQAIHFESNRKEKPFLAINCGAISESLLQSELFGYEQGAFTGASKSKIGILEEAGEGTVFLDEIGEISPAIQVALLRVLENNEIRPVGGTKTRKLRCRILAATNASLSELVDKNKFRKDLFYRLQRFQINLPPLRERKEDIRALAIYYLSKERNNKKVTVSDRFIEILEKYPWPGNIRELRNEMEKIALLNIQKNEFTEMDLNQNKFQVNLSTIIKKAKEELINYSFK